jgi:hypothetical protein
MGPGGGQRHSRGLPRVGANGCRRGQPAPSPQRRADPREKHSDCLRRCCCRSSRTSFRRCHRQRDSNTPRRSPARWSYSCCRSRSRGPDCRTHLCPDRTLLCRFRSRTFDRRRIPDPNSRSCIARRRSAGRQDRDSSPAGRSVRRGRSLRCRSKPPSGCSPPHTHAGRSGNDTSPGRTSCRSGIGCRCSTGFEGCMSLCNLAPRSGTHRPSPRRRSLRRLSPRRPSPNRPSLHPPSQCRPSPNRPRRPSPCLLFPTPRPLHLYRPNRPCRQFHPGRRRGRRSSR